MGFWQGKKVLVTGGSGFIGSHLVDALVEQQAKVTITVRESANRQAEKNLKQSINKINLIKADLSNQSDCLKACKGQEIVFNLAALLGNLEFNKNHPATILQANILINANLLEAARQSGVDRFLVMSSANVYPEGCKTPFKEEDAFNGGPEETNFGYGWSKRINELQAIAFNKEFGLKTAIARPMNVYGPKDNFDADKGHVIPALIARIANEKKQLIVYGSGKQERAFIFVKDLVKGLMFNLEKYPQPDPINFSSDEIITIKQLAELIMKLSNKNLELVFDSSKQSGLLKSFLDTKKASELLGFKAETSLKEGLLETINWFNENKK